MSPDAVLITLLEIHREFEADSGEDPDVVQADTKPLTDLKGFDSLLIPNVVRLLAKEYKITLPKGSRLRNPYAPRDGRPMTVRDVATRFCELCLGGNRWVPKT